MTLAAEANKVSVDRLSARLVILFAKVKSRKKQLAEKEERMAKGIKKIMREGTESVSVEKKTNDEGNPITTFTYAPPSSPYMLEKTEYEKADISWKDEAERMYKVHFGKTWRSELQAFKTQAETVPADKLECKVNPNYRP